VSIVEDMAEDLNAETDAELTEVTLDFLTALVEEFGIRLRGGQRARQ